MNYIKHLTGFFEKVAIDKTLNPTHISLYVALFQFWNCNRFKNPISINRDEVMRISKISSKATYHKCLKNLHSPSEVEAFPLKKVTPSIEEIKTYFQENNFPEQEAQKFFNYFKSVGWLVGGKTPMVDWQAAAQNWMINAPKFISNAEQPNRAKQLNTTTDKDYSEPL